MKTTVFVILIVVAAAMAGPRIGGRVGYTTAEDPFTGLSADGAIFGGQITFPLMPVLGIEVSGTYTSTKSDVSMESYLINYLEDNYPEFEYNGNADELRSYMENELGWTLPSEADMLDDYTATYHNLGLASILRADIPMGASPFSPYVGGGGGVHFVVSDADAMLAMVKQQTGQPAIDAYDHVFPSAEGVIGMNFKPAGAPVSVFGEVRLSKPFGDDAGDAIVTYFGGANLGF